MLLPVLLTSGISPGLTRCDRVDLEALEFGPPLRYIGSRSAGLLVGVKAVHNFEHPPVDAIDECGAGPTIEGVIGSLDCSLRSS